MMKVTFVIPPALDGKMPADRCFGCNYGIYPIPHIPTLYAATLLSRNSIDAAIHDFAARKSSPEDFALFARDDRSDLYVFFSVFLSAATDIAARTITRKARKDARFIFCGTQPTWDPDRFVDADSFVIRGEPEFPLLHLVRALEQDGPISGIENLSWLDNGRIVHNPSAEPLKNLDSLPMPDRTLLDHTPYFNPKLSGTPHTAILTSRGCFGACTYCVPNSLSFARELEYKRSHPRKPAPRLHSVQRVIEEFRAIHDLGFRSVTVLDDEFLWNEDRTVAICDGIRNLGLEWLCLARPDMITERSVQAMAAAGCRSIDLGVESFDQRILDDVGKKVTVAQIRSAVTCIRAAGIEPKVNILFGASPLETEETIRETVAAAEALGTEFVLYGIAAPFPGTAFYDSAKKNHWFATPDNEYHPVDHSAESIIAYPHLSKDQLEQALSDAYRRHYFSPRYIAGQVRALRSLSDLRHKLAAAGGIFRRHGVRSLRRGRKL